jgi:hypothetical protein
LYHRKSLQDGVLVESMGKSTFAEIFYSSIPFWFVSLPWVFVFFLIESNLIQSNSFPFVTFVTLFFQQVIWEILKLLSLLSFSQPFVVLMEDLLDFVHQWLMTDCFVKFEMASQYLEVMWFTSWSYVKTIWQEKLILVSVPGNFTVYVRSGEVKLFVQDGLRQNNQWEWLNVNCQEERYEIDIPVIKQASPSFWWWIFWKVCVYQGTWWRMSLLEFLISFQVSQGLKHSNLSDGWWDCSQFKPA